MSSDGRWQFVPQFQHTLVRLLGDLKSPFSTFKNRANNSTCIIRLLRGLNELIHGIHFEKFLEYNKHSAVMSMMMMTMLKLNR